VRPSRLRPLPASGRLALSLVCAVAAVLAAGLAFLAGAVALGSTACGTALISLALAAIQWHTMRSPGADDDEEVTIDLHLQPLSLVVFELDGFERARPERRDQALRLLGSAIRRTLRECDTACRYGDAAVAVLLEDTPESGAAAAAERVRKAVTMSPTGRSFTLSAGIACYPSHALDAHDLLRRSVQALAAARAAGRDRVEIAGVDQ